MIEWVFSSFLDWVLRTDANLDGDSLSYMDMLERNSAEERRRERERTMMEEGKALWKIKMDEEREMELRSQQQVTTSFLCIPHFITMAIFTSRVWEFTGYCCSHG